MADMGREFFEAFKIGIREGLDRAGIWQDISKEFLQLGWLCEALRGSPQLKNLIGPTVRLCAEAAETELTQVDKFMSLYRSHLKILENERDLCEIDGDWSE